jgi:L-asparaginase II
MTGESVAGFGIDGCSAPNFAASLRGFATAMARFAAAETSPAGARRGAAIRLRAAMVAHPELVSGTGGATTELMQAATGGTAVKSGAEGVYFAMLPARGLGLALKIADGASRASECAVTALLVRLGAADAAHPLVAKRLRPDLVNRAGTVVGGVRPAEGLWQDGRAI